MTREEWEKTVAVCDTCETICTAWVTPTEEIVSISPNTGCECDEPGLRVLDAETVFDGNDGRAASG